MTMRALVVGLAALPALIALPPAARAEPNTLTCALTRAGTEFAGTCEVPCSVNALAIEIDGPNARKACDGPPRRVEASLYETGAGRFRGIMQGKFPEDPPRFELAAADGARPGVAKTPYGWFALASMRQDGDTLHLTIAANNQLPPTADDIRILARAKALLKDETVWNRQDTRKCPAGARTWSVFCALQQATQEVSGGIHYRQPALQMVREVLDEIGGDRLGKHRLMDYNNHPATTLAEIHALLDTAHERLEKRLR
jgi:hypothetical protein